MSKEENIKAFLKLMGKDLNVQNVNFEIIQDDECLNIDKLQIGLVSGFCVWSDYTFGIGKRFIDELSSELGNNEITHFLLDCDFISVELQEKLFKSNRWGHFESCWIENGEIQKRYKYGNELDPFLIFVKNRLKEITGHFESKGIRKK